MQRANATAMGCEEAFHVPAEQTIKIERQGFDESGMDPRRFRETETAVRSPMTPCQDVMMEILAKAESRSEAGTVLRKHFQPDTTSETRRLTRKSIAMYMEPSKNPMEFTLRTDRVNTCRH